MTYIFYVIFFGFFFLIRYLIKERGIKSSKELAHLVFFPMTGYGNWIYNHKIRESEEVFLPRKWYIWKKMIFQNFWLIILSIPYTVFLLVVDTYYTLIDDGAIKVSSGTIHFFEDNIDPTLGIGLIFSGLSIAFIPFSLLFFLVIIPAIIAKSIKRTYTKKDE